MPSALLFDRDGPIVTLTMNRPESRNPVGETEDADLFCEAADRLNRDHTVKAVILTGAGPAFSAGGNLRAIKERFDAEETGMEIRQRYKDTVHRLGRALWTLEVPLIAAVNGAAIGLGNDMACLADIRIASSTAIFGATFLRIGLIPGDGGAWLLPRVIGMARAAELFYTGKTIDAQTALEWGLVNRVVAPDLLMTEARALAASIAEQPAHALRMTKSLMRESIHATFDAVMDTSASAQALAHQTPEHKAAINAFFTKAKR